MKSLQSKRNFFILNYRKHSSSKMCFIRSIISFLKIDSSRKDYLGTEVNFIFLSGGFLKGELLIWGRKQSKSATFGSIFFSKGFWRLWVFNFLNRILYWFEELFFPRLLFFVIIFCRLCIIWFPFKYFSIYLSITSYLPSGFRFYLFMFFNLYSISICLILF